MKQIDVYEAQSVIEKSIGYMVYEDKSTLIALLRKNGVQVPEKVSDDDLIRMTYVAIAKSLQFKKDLAKYLESKTIEAYEGYVDEEFFNGDGKGKKVNPNLIKQGGKGTKVGNAVRSIATQENIQTAINTGIGLLSDSLSAKADQKSIQQATQLATEKSKQAIAEAQAEDAKKSKIKSWVIPVVIGVIVIGGIVTYLVIKKRKA